MYKAVIFDLDGTLLDTISDITDSVNAALDELGYKQFSESEYKYFVGRGIDELIHTIIKEAKIDTLEFNKIRDGYIKEYAKRNSFKTKPYPGIIDLLNNLKNNGIKICVLSNKPHFQTLEVIEKYFRKTSFDIVFGKKDDYPIKPNPKSAQEIIKMLNLDRGNILYVGDTNTDIETAINAKLKSVGVLWGFRKSEELKEAGADFIVNNANEILNIVLGV